VVEQPAIALRRLGILDEDSLRILTENGSGLRVLVCKSWLTLSKALGAIA